MWFLEIKCISDLILCTTLLVPPDLPPRFDRWHDNKASCEHVLLDLAKFWKPSHGAWTFNCIMIVR